MPRRSRCISGRWRSGKRPGAGASRYGRQPQQPGRSVSRPGQLCARPSRCISGRWRSGKRPWGRSIRIRPPASTTWQAVSRPGQVRQAEPLYQRALAIREKALGPEHPDTATSLNNLADLYRDQGKYAPGGAAVSAGAGDQGKGPGAGASRHGHQPQQPGRSVSRPGQLRQAEPLYQRALAIDEKVLGPEHPARPRASTTWQICIATRASMPGRAAVSAGAGDQGKGPGAGASGNGHQPEQPGQFICRPGQYAPGRAAVSAGAGD